MSRRGAGVRRFAILSSCAELWGGSEELWFETACALREAGHRVDVLKTRVDPHHRRIRELKARGSSVADLSRPGPDFFWHAAHSPLAARFAVPLQLALAGPRLARPPRPDLAIVTQGGNFDGVNFGRLCEKLGIPYLLVSQKASPLHWPPDSARGYIRKVHEHARRTVFVSHHNARLTRLQMDTDLPNAIVLHNPILAGRNGPLPWPAEGSPVRLACIGRLWTMEKGQDLLFDVLDSPVWRARDIAVHVYGQGLNSQGLESLARRLGLGNVTFHGQVDDIKAIWREHHGLILTSRTEGMPLVLYEAMACGRVPIVTDVGGSAEIVDDGVTGFVAESAGPGAIAAALERAWERRGDWAEIGRAASSRIDGLRRERGRAPLADLALAEAGGPQGASRPALTRRWSTRRRRR
jgi:glycosyltransferase involved in cell wall biosynthesis